LAQNIPGLNLTPPGTLTGITAATETGFYNPNLTAPYNLAGLADFGTRLQAVFTNLPTGVNIYVGLNQIVTAGVTAFSSPTAMARLIASDTGPYQPVLSVLSSTIYVVVGASTVAVQVSLLPTSNNSATATWEVTNSSALVIENLDFPFFVNYSSNTATNTPAPGTTTVNGKFAPINSSTSGANSNPVPRFVDASKAVNAFKINLCITNLLFPYVTNQAGFDTGLSIANTTTDIFGTNPQTGTCALNFYGANKPAVYTTPAVASGALWADLASTLSPNFSGYIIAQCKFQYGHGFAFVSDLGARTIAMGYLALVMPDGGRTNASSGGALAAGTGELLGQ
jgi:hypothetical protein